jgi:Ca2+-binding EF-hand superfamily protein
MSTLTSPIPVSPLSPGRFAASLSSPLASPHSTTLATATSASSAIFKPKRAKQLFKQFDLDKDRYLSRAEFEAGIKLFLSLQNNNVENSELQLSSEAIEALWKETDLNNDKRISYAEFAFRFAGGPNPLQKSKFSAKQSLILQSPKAQINRGSKLTVGEMKQILESLYDGGKRRYKQIEIGKISRQITPNQLKKTLNLIFQCERGEAAAQNRPLLECFRLPAREGNISQKDSDKLFNYFDQGKTGLIDLTNFFEQAKIKPSLAGIHNNGAVAKKKSKKMGKKGSENQGKQQYLMQTVKGEHLRDFLNDQLLFALAAKENQNYNEAVESGRGVGEKPKVRAHPALKHWGDEEKARRSLVDSGYKTTIFLSERTKIKATVRIEKKENQENQADNGTSRSNNEARPLSPKSHIEFSTPSTARTANNNNINSNGLSPNNNNSSSNAGEGSASHILMFVLFRTEYTSKARSEHVYHAVLRFDGDEMLQSVEYREKKRWVDGELENYEEEEVIPRWIEFVGIEAELEELSIPPIA